MTCGLERQNDGGSKDGTGNPNAHVMAQVQTDGRAPKPSVTSEITEKS